MSENKHELIVKEIRGNIHDMSGQLCIVNTTLSALEDILPILMNGYEIALSNNPDLTPKISKNKYALLQNVVRAASAESKKTLGALEEMKSGLLSLLELLERSS